MIGKSLKNNVVLAAIAAVLAYSALLLAFARGTDRGVWYCVKSVLGDTFLSPLFIFAVVFILILERIFPADKTQKIFSAGFIQDSVWLLLALLFTATVVAAYSRGLRTLYETYLEFLTVKGVGRFPEWARMTLGILVGDFLSWFQHWLKHQVPWFWRIHVVHHSQRQINMFTDLRFHYMEYIISRPIVLIPLLILSIDTPKIVAFTVFSTWYTRLYHANIRSNFGWLRYIFVTPQSHRIHHSIDLRHRDQNFGVIFSFWDRIFRTHQPDCDSYPQTGVEDSSVPVEKEDGILSFLILPLRQLAYPFLPAKDKS